MRLIAWRPVSLLSGRAIRPRASLSLTGHQVLSCSPKRYIFSIHAPIINRLSCKSISGTYLAGEEVDPLKAVSEIPSIPSESLRSDIAEKEAVILLSKPFARHIRPDDPFLSSLINKLFLNISANFNHDNFRVHTTIAIVHRIPAVLVSASLTSESQSVPSHTLADAGKDGISFVAADAPFLDVNHSLFSKNDTSPPHVSFTIVPSMGSATVDLKLPVANTLFENGSTSTLLSVTWTAEGTTLVQGEYSKLFQASLRYIPRYDLPPGPTSKLLLPNEPLTGVSRIHKGLGNVIRQLESPSTGEISPASAELTKAIIENDWNIGHVYAIITSHRPNQENLLLENLEDYLRYGAIIRRVTGGGGEWGNRAALITLDDQNVYAAKSGTPISEGADLIGTLWDREQSIVPEGHFIQFYQGLDSDLSPDLRPLAAPREAATRGYLKLGIVLDDVPPSPFHPESSFRYHVFGGLSTMPIGIASATGYGLYSSYVDVPWANILCSYPLDSEQSWRKLETSLEKQGGPSSHLPSPDTGVESRDNSPGLVGFGTDDSDYVDASKVVKPSISEQLRFVKQPIKSDSASRSLIRSIGYDSNAKKLGLDEDRRVVSDFTIKRKASVPINAYANLTNPGLNKIWRFERGAKEFSIRPIGYDPPGPTRLINVKKGAPVSMPLINTCPVDSKLSKGWQMREERTGEVVTKRPPHNPVVLRKHIKNEDIAILRKPLVSAFHPAPESKQGWQMKKKPPGEAVPKRTVRDPPLELSRPGRIGSMQRDRLVRMSYVKPFQWTISSSIQAKPTQPELIKNRRIRKSPTSIGRSRWKHNALSRKSEESVLTSKTKASQTHFRLKVKRMMASFPTVKVRHIEGAFKPRVTRQRNVRKSVKVLLIKKALKLRIMPLWTGSATDYLNLCKRWRRRKATRLFHELMNMGDMEDDLQMDVQGRSKSDSMPTADTGEREEDFRDFEPESGAEDEKFRKLIAQFTITQRQRQHKAKPITDVGERGQGFRDGEREFGGEEDAEMGKLMAQIMRPQRQRQRKSKPIADVGERYIRGEEDPEMRKLMAQIMIPQRQRRSDHQ